MVLSWVSFLSCLCVVAGNATPSPLRWETPDDSACGEAFAEADNDDFADADVVEEKADEGGFWVYK